MSMHSSRREFLRNAALTGLGVWVADSAYALGKQSANDKVNIACIGVGGKGDSDSNNAASHGNIVAICDVDDNTLAKAAAKWPNAKTYNDYRKMLDEMGKSIDAVTVSIPDHQHAIATSMAIQMGKHVYCQKPLTHSIWEARRIGQLAAKMKVATQMGNQGTASNSLRKNAYTVRAGALGTATEVHVWTNRPIWPQGIDRPSPADVPANLHWDLWLGPAPDRPYGNGYHPFSWRGFWDFGTGALGDMACHTVNMPYMALNLRDPSSVVAKTSGNNKESYPKSSTITFEFPALNGRPALTMTWYDGGAKPPNDLLPADLLPISDSGCLIIGDKGKLYSPGDTGDSGHIIDGVDVGTVDFPHSPGEGEGGHWDEFIRAIKNPDQPATSNFPNYAGPLVETILLGNLAVWADGKKIEWDPKNLKAKNAPEVSHIIKPTYKHGYSV